MSKLTVKLLQSTIEKLKQNFQNLTITTIQLEIAVELRLPIEDVEVRTIDNGYLIKIFEPTEITVIAITEGIKEA